MHWTWWLNFSSVFRDIAVGLGAIAGGVAAIPVIDDWLKQKNKRNYRAKWEKRLSRARFDKGEFTLLKLDSGDEIYAVDESDQSKWWIRNLATLHDLGYTGRDATDTPKKKLDKYKSGKAINFYPSA